MKRPTWLSKLLDQGYVAYSATKSKKAQNVITTLETMQLLEIEFKGTQQRTVRVTDRVQFEQWVEVNYRPSELDDTLLAPRGRNIVDRGSSKSGPTTHKVQPVLFKWFDPDVNSSLAQQTTQFGFVGATSDRLERLKLSQPWRLLTIENWETFYLLDYPQPTAATMAVYLIGQVAEVTLTALAAIQPTPQSILHFGDYDWAGLTIFQIIQKAFPQAGLYIPDNIEELFSKYSKRELITRQVANSQGHSADPRCQQIIELIAEYNAGLEQEIVPWPTDKDFEAQLH